MNGDKFYNLVKKAAVGAVNETKPVELYIGTYSGGSVIIKNNGGTLVVGGKDLIILNSCRNHTVPGYVTYTKKGKEISKNIKVKLKYALSDGERVMVARMSGGGKYVVVDRV